MNNIVSLDKFDRSQFTILATARTQTKLDTLESLYIKKLTPDLCKQKEFVTKIHL